MIDFKELPQDGTNFEQLIRELTLREGYIPHWTGVGSDGGRDLIIEESVEGLMQPPLSRKWLVSCKHNAHANQGNGKSVGLADINGLIDAFNSCGADGIILACSTHPSSSVITRLREIESTKNISCKYWDGVDIEKRLMKANTYSLMQIFFQILLQNLKSRFTMLAHQTSGVAAIEGISFTCPQEYQCHYQIYMILES